MAEERAVFDKDNFLYELNSKGNNLQFEKNAGGCWVGITYVPTEEEQKLINAAKEDPNSHPTAGECFPYSYTGDKTFGHMDTTTGKGKGGLHRPSLSSGSPTW